MVTKNYAFKTKLYMFVLDINLCPKLTITLSSFFMVPRSGMYVCILCNYNKMWEQNKYKSMRHMFLLLL